MDKSCSFPSFHELNHINKSVIRSTYKIIYASFLNSFSFSYMAGKNAYDLKKLLAVYNLGQVFACSYLIIGILSTEFNIIKFWKCQSVEYKNDEKSMAALTYAYQTFLLKLVELIETVFFVLRKKQNQVSKLHVYHHVSTAMLGYIMTKYTGGMFKFKNNELNCRFTEKQTFILIFINNVNIQVA